MAAAASTAAAVPDVTLIIVPGSLFSIKAMAALDARGIAYDLHWTSLDNLRNELPAPHQVPVMVWNQEIIADSTDILRRIDKELQAQGKDLLFPKDLPEVEAFEEEIDEKMAPLIFYFAFVDKDCWAKGFEKLISEQIPGWLQGLGYTASVAVEGARDRYAAKTGKLVGQEVGPEDGRLVLERGLAPLLGKYEASIKDGSTYLCGSSVPTAADCALFSMLERSVGADGKAAGDVEFVAILPDLLAPYPKLRKLHSTMRAEHPIVFKGKRREAGKPRLPLPGLYARKPVIPARVWDKMGETCSCQ